MAFLPYEGGDLSDEEAAELSPEDAWMNMLRQTAQRAESDGGMQLFEFVPEHPIVSAEPIPDYNPLQLPPSQAEIRDRVVDELISMPLIAELAPYGWYTNDLMAEADERTA